MATIFDAIVRKENDYTNLLRNLLEREPAFAAKVLMYLIDRPVGIDECLSFSYRTQQRFVSQDSFVIPDLVIEGEQLLCIIEIKTGYATEAQPSQQEAYKDCFGVKREQYFILLVPEDWYGIAMPIVAPTVGESGVVLSKTKTWQELSGQLHELAREMPEMVRDHVLQEATLFLCESFEVFDMTHLELTSSEWRTNYIAFRTLQRIVDKAEKIFRAHGLETEKEASDLDAYGFYIKHDGKYRLWVGLWTEGTTILSFGYHRSSSVWDKPSVPQGGSELKRSHMLWPLPEINSVDPKKIFTTVSEFYKESWPGSSPNL